jgi:hypothetical protein
MILAFAASFLPYGTAFAQNDQVKGVINERNGATMTVQWQKGGNVTVVLTPSTQVEEPEGIFREKHLSMTALIPGLAVEVKGSYNAKNQLVADDIKFSGSALKTAEDIQAGLTPTKNEGSAKSKSDTGRKTKPSAGTATTYGRTAEDCGQQSGYCGRQQALWRAG